MHSKNFRIVRTRSVNSAATARSFYTEEIDASRTVALHKSEQRQSSIVLSFPLNRAKEIFFFTELIYHGIQFTIRHDGKEKAWRSL